MKKAFNKHFTVVSGLIKPDQEFEQGPVCMLKVSRVAIVLQSSILSVGSLQITSLAVPFGGYASDLQVIALLTLALNAQQTVATQRGWLKCVPLMCAVTILGVSVMQTSFMVHEGAPIHLTGLSDFWRQS